MSTQRFEARGDGDDPDDCEGADRQRRSLHVPERAFGRIEQSRPAAKKTAVEIADLCFREHRDEPKRS